MAKEEAKKKEKTVEATATATAQPTAPANEQPQPDPAMILAQSEIAKNKADNAVARMKLFMEDDRRRDEAETEAMLKAAEIQAKYGTQVNVQELRNILERDKEELRQRAKLAGMVLGGGNGQT